MVFETADPHFDKQINTHFTAISAYLEKQVCFNNHFFQKHFRFFNLGWIINTSTVNDPL
jgi:hypothetical protein